jgi:hypothetical protein
MLTAMQIGSVNRAAGCADHDVMMRSEQFVHVIKSIPIQHGFCHRNGVTRCWHRA